MSALSYDISALSMEGLLNVTLASGWKEELLHDTATVCYTGRKIELGFVTTVIVEEGNYSYSVSEYADYHDGEFYDTHNLKTLEEAISRITERATYWMETQP